MSRQQKPYLTNQEKHLNYLKKEKNLNPVIASLKNHFDLYDYRLFTDLFIR